MKPSIFLLGTILICAPYAFGQTASVAVTVPVANTATATPSDAELQAKVDAAAQALAKLPENTSGLATAQARVATARASVVVPVTFSLGQSGRQAHLVLDNLRSARVWCEVNAKIAGPDNKTLLNNSIELLQGAENMAQQKVDVLDKPDTRTLEQLKADSKRILEESGMFLKGVEEREAIRKVEIEKNRQKSSEILREMRESLKELRENRVNFIPTDPKKEAEEQEAREREFKQLMLLLQPSVLKIEEARDKESEVLLNASKTYMQKSGELESLRVKATNPNLSESARQKLNTQIEAVAKEEKAAGRNFDSSSERIEHLTDELKKVVEPKLGVTQSSAFLYQEASTARFTEFYEVQFQGKTYEQLRKERDDAEAAQQTAQKEVDDIDAQLKPLLLPLEGIDIRQRSIDLYNKIQPLQDAVTRAKAVLGENPNAFVDLFDKAVKDKEAELATAKVRSQNAATSLEQANAGLTAALAAMANATKGVCIGPELFAELNAAIEAAKQAIKDAEKERDDAKTNEEQITDSLEVQRTNLRNAKAQVEAKQKALADAQKALDDARKAFDDFIALVNDINDLRGKKADANGRLITAKENYEAAKEAFEQADPPTIA